MTRYHYVHMTGHEFRKALADLGLNFNDFARLIGSRTDRVGKWANDADRIPHHVRVLLVLLQMPGALSIGRQITDAAIDEEV